jgi:hypothetical protein
VSADEDRAAEFLAKRGLSAVAFSKEELRAGKTPDFRVMARDAFGFFCEVKSIEKDTAEGLRKDPVFNRLTDDIHTAVKQFDAVNSKVDSPNVLVLVNHDKHCSFLDLIGVLTGNFIADDGGTHPIYKQFSEGRIKDEKARIHLFLWLDDFKPERLLFTQTHAGFHRNLCAWLGVDSRAIKQIDS